MDVSDGDWDRKVGRMGSTVKHGATELRSISALYFTNLSSGSRKAGIPLPIGGAHFVEDLGVSPPEDDVGFSVEVDHVLIERRKPFGAHESRVLHLLRNLSENAAHLLDACHAVWLVMVFGSSVELGEITDNKGESLVSKILSEIGD
jgi:hypothetical protein